MSNLNSMKIENAEMKKQLQSTEYALKDVTSEMKVMKRQCDQAKRDIISLQRLCESAQYDSASFEEAVEDTLEENLELSKALVSVRKELSTIKDATSIIVDLKKMNFSFETKDGKRYSPTIRKLYYTLLADQIPPPKKIYSTIKAVLKCFFPSLDAENLKMPLCWVYEG